MATAVLLGAGASTDAGIPKSVDLTREIYEYLSQQGDDEKRQARALGTVIAGLSYRNAQSGISPYNLIDVEQVVATIQLLANRYNSEVMPLSPFINGWDRIIDEIDRLPLPDYRFNSAYRSIMGGVHQAIEGKNPDYNESDPVRDEFRKEWRDLFEESHNPSQQGVFQSIYQTMVGFLVERLKPRQGVDLDYLKPLLNLSHPLC